jgi:hypothetical protein
MYFQIVHEIDLAVDRAIQSDSCWLGASVGIVRSQIEMEFSKH